MTAAQPKLIDGVAPKLTNAKGLWVDYECAGDSVTGTIGLSQPNPFGRSNCRIRFKLRDSWTKTMPDVARAKPGWECPGVRRLLACP